MNPPRRYDDREIALIFERASMTQPASSTDGGAAGLTLAQLHDIGRDVGIPAEQITRAAAAFERSELAPARQSTWIGLPIGVDHTVELDRRVSEDEWARLVMTLRDTFGARGQVEVNGPFREWRNGNLSALLERTERGHRLRLSTRRGDARGRLTIAGFCLSTAAVFGVLSATGVMTANAGVPPTVLLGLMGAGTLASLVLRLPRWARMRSRQMEFIARQLAAAVQDERANALVSPRPTLPD